MIDSQRFEEFGRRVAVAMDGSNLADLSFGEQIPEIAEACGIGSVDDDDNFRRIRPLSDDIRVGDRAEIELYGAKEGFTVVRVAPLMFWMRHDGGYLFEFHSVLEEGSTAQNYVDFGITDICDMLDPYGTEYVYHPENLVEMPEGEAGEINAWAELLQAVGFPLLCKMLADGSLHRVFS